MKILWIGGCIAEKDFQYILAHETGYVQFAAQKVCSMFLRGVDAANEAACDVIWGFRVSNYPRFRKLVAFDLPPTERGGAATGSYGRFFTLPGLCYLSTAWSVWRIVNAWRKKYNTDRNKVIILYSASTPYLLAAWWAKVIFRVPYAVIVPDLPEFCGNEGNFLIAVLRSVNNRITHLLLKQANGLIVFSRHMLERIPHRSDCSVEVVEGCVDTVETDLAGVDLLRCSADKKVVFYSGALYAKYGVRVLLEAFSAISDADAELWLCGNGDMVDEINEAAKIDKRIVYFGVIPNNQVILLQRQASLLVNPRGGREPFTRYSFPSKNLEYLSSARPVALVRMDGIPEEYFQYVMIIADDSVDAMSSVLKKVMRMSKEELDIFGRAGRQFVFSEKNYLKQGQKIYKVLNEIISAQEKQNV